MNNYVDYEKISDMIMPLGYNAFLKMNLVLGRKDRNNKRIHYYKEFAYNTNKYTNVNTCYNINRNFDYYLSIERYGGESKEFIMIREENILELRYYLTHIVYPWLLSKDIFEDKENNNTWILKHGKWDRVYCGVAGNKWISFEPILIPNMDGTNTKGIRLSLNSDISYIDIPMNRFSGFSYNINSIYLFQCAQNMLNFLQRPELGTNLTKYSYRSELEDVVEDISGGGDSIHGGSSVVMKKGKSVFDEIDGM